MELGASGISEGIFNDTWSLTNRKFGTNATSEFKY